MELWNNGIMEFWNHGIMESWNHGIMESWKHGDLVGGREWWDKLTINFRIFSQKYP